MRHRSHAPLRDRSGFFLIVVLIVIMVATMAAYSFTDTMLSYDEATHLSSDHVQTQAAADSGVEAVRMILAQPADIRDSFGGIKDNPALFQAVNIVAVADGGRACNFSIVAPGMDETGRIGGIRFGLQNESARLNVNALITLEKNSSGIMPMLALAASSGIDAATTEQLASDNLASSLLLALPGMTTDIADCILDWLDEDDEPRPFGAEVEYYSTLPTPYKPANGPINSVEELLLVRGVTPALLFGVDANRNGVVDAAEQQTAIVDINSVSSLGLAAYITVHGLESNRRRDGSARIDVNQDDLEALYEEIATVIENEDYATYIAAYRVYGKSAATPTSSGGSSNSSGGGSGQSGSQTSPRPGQPAVLSASAQAGSSGGGSNNSSRSSGGGNRPPLPWTASVFEEIDLSGGSGTKFKQILDVIDSTVTVGNGDSAQVYTSPFTSDPVQMALYMPLLMENFSTQDFETMPGRININECPAELLLGMPVLDELTATAILEARAEPSESENRRYETWPLVEGILTIDQMRTLMPLVTAGGDVYRAQVVGYYEGAAASTRVEAIVDGTSLNPKVIHYRDLSHLGRGFDAAVLGLRNLPSTSMGTEGN
ncbi:MAG: general secretion pathway protein GspK [Planctomycetaceae bacterium]